MKKLLLLVLVFVFAGGAAIAQDQQKQKEDWDKKVKEELKLTPEQIVKYDALSKEYAPKMEAIMKDASLAPDAQKEKKMALKKEKETKLFEFLTPEQQTKYKEMIEKKKKGEAKS